MSQSQRNLSNPPDHYYQLDTKQQQNWKRTTKKIEKNEALRRKYPPFQSSTNTTIHHLHHSTPITTINDLIMKARATKLYTIDTESQMINKKAKGALVQISMVESEDSSTILLFETLHLPNQDSLLYTRMEELCATIFDMKNNIISWGPIKKELENFQHYQLFKSGNKLKGTNLQKLFSEWHNQQATIAHPERERRERGTWELYETPGDYDDPIEQQLMQIRCDCGHHSHYDPNGTWSLQDAVASAFQEFLDKTETINKWGCGLDFKLNTWKSKLFSKHQYNPNEEKDKRSLMEKYAINDCLAVSRLHFIIDPPHQAMETTTSITTSRNVIIDYEDELSEISDDELIEILKPKLNKPKLVISPPDDEPTALVINITPEETEEFNIIPQQTTTRLTKSEKQKRKNMKLKWKQQNRPDFQNKIKRPIYYKYDYRKIRSQLLDDDIYTSHQITIDEKRSEVIIVFKSAQEQQRATTKIKINYFSKKQYEERWRK